MEVQLKKGLLDIVVLSTLINNDSYGYKIIQQISKIIDVSESTLYPILRRLESASCLKTYKIEHNGRLRKYYKITAEGKKRIDSFLEEWKELNQIHEFILLNLN